MEDVRDLLRDMQAMTTSEQEEHLRVKMNEVAEKAKENALESLRAMVDTEEIRRRFGYHKATEKTGPMHQAVRGEFIALSATLNALLPGGRAKSVCFTELENASMWANKAIAELAPVVNE